MNIRWGLIGCGSIADNKVAPAIQGARDSQLVAVMGRHEERTQAFAQKHGIPRRYHHLHDLLSDDQIDAVYIATPPDVHAEFALACARAGKHVICEKPMALTTAQCDEMIRAAGECHVTLMIAYYRRRFPIVLKMKEILAAGRLGRPVKIRSEIAFFYGPAADGSQPWRTDPSVAGGGILWDIGSHRIDLMIDLMGEVRDVTAFTDTTTFDIPVEDSASLLLRFASGAQGAGLFHWNVTGGSDEMEIGGTEGRLLCDLNKGHIRLTTNSGIQEWTLPAPPNPHLDLVEDFLLALRTGRDNCCTGQEGRKTNQVIEAAGRSSREGKTILLDR